jgi:hypothetical protein
MVICGPFQRSRGLAHIPPLSISLHMSQRTRCPQSPGPAMSHVNACRHPPCPAWVCVVTCTVVSPTLTRRPPCPSSLSHPPCCRLTLCARVHSTVSPTMLLSCRLVHPSILPALPILAVLPILIHPHSLTHPCLPRHRCYRPTLIFPDFSLFVLTF